MKSHGIICLQVSESRMVEVHTRTLGNAERLDQWLTNQKCPFGHYTELGIGETQANDMNESEFGKLLIKVICG